MFGFPNKQPFLMKVVNKMKDVYLLSGFLGSGKTSALIDILRQLKEKGLKPAVMMNELGQLAFDSQSVDDEIPLKEMLEGCICCSGAEQTEAQIQTLLHDFEFDVLIIETTGAAHPVEAIDAVYSPIFADKLNIKGIVTVADSKMWLHRDELTPQVRSLFLEQIRHAHLLLANKMDLLSESEQAKIVFEMQQVNPDAFLLQTTNAKVPLHLLEGLQSTVRISKESVQPANINELRLSSRLVEFHESFTKEQFELWIQSLPDTVYRIKGYVPIEGVQYPFLFQYAYGLTQWLPEFMNMPAKIVIIGENVHTISIIGE